MPRTGSHLPLLNGYWIDVPGRIWRDLPQSLHNLWANLPF
jgi:hypothetical protein